MYQILEEDRMKEVEMILEMIQTITAASRTIVEINISIFSPPCEL